MISIPRDTRTGSRNVRRRLKGIVPEQLAGFIIRWIFLGAAEMIVVILRCEHFA